MLAFNSSLMLFDSDDVVPHHLNHAQCEILYIKERNLPHLMNNRYRCVVIV